MYVKTYDTIDGCLVSIRIELQFDFMISSWTLLDLKVICHVRLRAAL